MYKKGTIFVRVRVDDWSYIGIGSIVRLEETAHSRTGNYLVTRLKTVEPPRHKVPIPITHGVNLGDFIPIRPLKRKHNV
jgi:hypothetical protein